MYLNNKGGKVVDNREFWNKRYRENPELGSGPGSRGYAAWIKSYVIEKALQLNDISTIIDIGCGDLCWFKDGILGDTDYVGVDISEAIIERNRSKFPDLKFKHHDLAEAPIELKADLVVSFDVLIHQCSFELFLRVLKNIISSTKRHALISYLTPGEQMKVNDVIPKFIIENAPASVIEEEKEFLRFFNNLDPNIPRAATAIYGDLKQLIERIDRNVVVRPLLQYREHTIYEITKDVCWLKWE